MFLKIGQRELADFDRPIDVLMDCHRRIENFFNVLGVIGERAKNGALDAEAKLELKTALDYFLNAAPKHKEDEELSLFPRLRALTGNEAEQAIEFIDELEEDHRFVEPMHAEINRIGRKWLGTVPPEPKDVVLFIDVLDELMAIYRAHIQVEESRIFTFAKSTLDKETLSEVGKEMAARRKGENI